MRYTILGFQQSKLIELGLDSKDALILRFFIDFRDTKKMRKEVIENEVYYWVKYKAIIEEYPILGIKNKDGIYRRLQKLVDTNILKHITIKDSGNYSYYTTDYKYLELISDNSISKVLEVSDEKPIGSDEKSEGIGPKVGRVSDEKSEGIGSKVGTNNPSTIYPSTINNPSTIYPYKDVLDYLNERINSKYRHSTKKTQELIKARVKEGFTLEDFKKVIDIKCKQWKGTEWEQYLRPETLFGTKFESYLNQRESYPSNKGNFNNFDQRSYDFESLERKLLGWDKEE